MSKLITITLTITVACTAYAIRPYYEEIKIDQLGEKAKSIILAELVSGTYNRDEERYNATLSTVYIIKGNSTAKFEVEHQYGWNRLDKLGGYYLIFLDSKAKLMETGSAIVPLVSFGGPFSDATLEEAAATYKLPERSWFTQSNKLWALYNCLGNALPTCEREKELIENTFNKSMLSQPTAAETR